MHINSFVRWFKQKNSSDVLRYLKQHNLVVMINCGSSKVPLFDATFIASGNYFWFLGLLLWLRVMFKWCGAFFTVAFAFLLSLLETIEFPSKRIFLSLLTSACQCLHPGFSSESKKLGIEMHYMRKVDLAIYFLRRPKIWILTTSRALLFSFL